MDRVQFLQSINYNDNTTVNDILVSFFDQYMLLYNIANDVDSVSILSSNGINSITFELQYSDLNGLNRLINMIMNNPIVVIYESTYRLQIIGTESNRVIINISK